MNISWSQRVGLEEKFSWEICWKLRAKTPGPWKLPSWAECAPSQPRTGQRSAFPDSSPSHQGHTRWHPPGVGTIVLVSLEERRPTPTHVQTSEPQDERTPLGKTPSQDFLKLSQGSSSVNLLCNLEWVTSISSLSVLVCTIGMKMPTFLPGPLWGTAH